MSNTVKKYINFILLTLPVLALVIYALASFRSAETLNDVVTQLDVFMTESLPLNADSPFGEAFVRFADMIESAVGINSSSFVFAFGYLAYVFVIELALTIFDLILFVPRKCREIFR